MRPIIPTGSSILDRFLEGGLQPRNVILLYGEAETGKTTLAVQCAVNAARLGYKAMFIDPESAFSPERLSQIAHYDLAEVSASIILVRPASFKEQGAVIDELEKYLTHRFGLIVFDTITSLYRSELGNAKETFALNRELNRQLATLAQISKDLGVSILLTSQVRSVFVPGKVGIAPVAVRVLKFWSDFVVKLEAAKERGTILAKVEKPVMGLRWRLAIEEGGIRDSVR